MGLEEGAGDGLGHSVEFTFDLERWVGDFGEAACWRDCESAYSTS